MKNENVKITIKSIWKWLRSEKGKRYSFLIFYLFFFIFVFIFISLPSNITTNNNENSNSGNNSNIQGESFPFSVKNLEEDDYKFTYIVNCDNNEADYIGEKNGNNIKLQDDRGEYNYSYKNGELKFDSLENSPVLVKFLDIFEIKKIIKNSELVSETKLITDNSYLYTYNIKTTDLLELYEEEIEVTEEIVNTINIKTDNENQIIEIKLDILGYMKPLKEDIIDKYEIVITYEDSNE